MPATQTRQFAGRPDGGQFTGRTRNEAEVALLPIPYPFTEPTVPLDPDEPVYNKPPRKPGQECLNSGRPLTHAQWSTAVKRPSEKEGYGQATATCWKCGAPNVLVERKYTKVYQGINWNYTRHAVPEFASVG